MNQHFLKIIEPYFSDVRDRKKNFELRQYTAQDDKPARDFKVGDHLILYREDMREDESAVERFVDYVLKDTDPCMEGKLAPGYCILGLH